MKRNLLVIVLGCVVFSQAKGQKYLDLQLPLLNAEFTSSIHHSNGYYLGPNWGAGTTMGGLGFLVINRFYMGLGFDRQTVKITAFQLEDYMMKSAVTFGEHDYERYSQWQPFNSYRFSLGYPIQVDDDVVVFSLSANVFQAIPKVGGSFRVFSDPKNEYDHPKYERLLDAGFVQSWKKRFLSARVEGSFHLGWRGYLNVYTYVNWYPGVSTDFVLFDGSFLNPRPAVEFSEKRSFVMVGMGMRFNVLWRIDRYNELHGDNE